MISGDDMTIGIHSGRRRDPGDGNGNDNQLRLNACMLAPAPP